MSKLPLAAVMVLALVSMYPSSAAAQVNVDLDITLEGITVLHYYSNLDVTIDSTALMQMLGATGGVVDEGVGGVTVSAYPFVGNADLQTNMAPPPGNPAAVDLTIQNVWAVRAITAAGTNTVSTVVTDGTLNHTAIPNVIDMSNSRVTDGVSTGFSIQFNSPGLINPVYGDVILELDLTNARVPGEYLNGEFMLQATTP